MHYLICKTPRGWTIYENRGGSAGAHIGTVQTRREAVKIARLLAGWGGSVAVVK